ncbi:MAG: hypothetical protein WB524_12355 [Acidobacteriaceae bacterium]
MSVGRTLKSYVWWTHERGSVHYDVMVTLILAFIFITPRFVNYGDRPKPDWPANEIRASINPAGGMIYEVPVELIQAHNGEPTDQELANAINATSGPIVVDRKQAVKEIGGSVIAWRVWGHR